MHMDWITGTDPAVKEGMEMMLSNTEVGTDDAFKLFDVDGDGEISLEELTLILRAQGHLMVCFTSLHASGDLVNKTAEEPS